MSKFNAHTILVTGGAGFIGSNFVRYALGKMAETRVVNLDALTYAGRRENLEDLPDPDRHTFVEGNINDKALVEELLREYDIDAVVHFAAESHVDRSILGPEAFVQTNVVGTFTLLECARKVWEEGEKERVRFHHISTDEVFGSLGPEEPAFNERTPYAPNSPYAASKAASDHLARAYHKTYGLPVIITNCSNNYGPRQFPEKLIPLTISNALEGRPLPVYGDGGQIRDWLYVEDHCAALNVALETGKPGETYNIGGNNQPSNLEVVQTICKILDEELPDSPHAPHSQLVQHVADRPGHDRRYAMDGSKMARELGWRPRETLESGLRKTVKWYLANREWAAAIRSDPAYEAWFAKNYGERERAA